MTVSCQNGSWLNETFALSFGNIPHRNGEAMDGRFNQPFEMDVWNDRFNQSFQSLPDEKYSNPTGLV